MSNVTTNNELPQKVTDEAVAADAVKETKTGRLLTLFRQYASLSDLLRYSGALSVAVAMGLFLIDGVALFTDLQRFLTMLGFTGALTAAGFAMSVFVKEQRGSRVFMSLALMSVPVNFAVFGALLYSYMPLDGVSRAYPAFAHWQAASVSDIATAIAVGLCVLVPVVWMGYSVLARTSRRWLSVAMLVGSAALVIPVRHEVIVAVLAVLTASGLWWMVQRNAQDSLVLKTAEGKLARGLLFLAPVILLGRSLFLYSASSVLFLMLAGGAFVATRQVLAGREKATFFTAVGTVFAGAAALVASAAGADLMNGIIQDEIAIVFGIGGFLIMNNDLVRVSANKGLAKLQALVSVVLGCSALVALALFDGSSMLLALCIATLLAISLYGYVQRYWSVMFIALAGVAVVAFANVDSMWSLALDTGWWGIATAGVVAIVAGSLVDRAGTKVVAAG